MSDSVVLTVAAGMLLSIDTTLGSGREFHLALSGSGSVRIAWGDGAVEEVTDPNGPRHEYATDGAYTIRVFGALTGEPLLGRSTTPLHVTSLNSWGDFDFISLREAFYGASNLTSVPDSLPPSVTDMSYMFGYAFAFNDDIGGWDTSNVTDMSYMFRSASAFNGDIGGWDTSNVRYMIGMFNNASSFNQDLSSWCVETFATAPFQFGSGASSWSPDFHPRWGEPCDDPD